MIPKFIKGMEAEETKIGKEWMVYPEGEEPIRVLVDRRLKVRTIKLLPGVETYDPGVRSYPEERLVSIRSRRVHPTSVGHEFGHILMGHEGLERDVVTLDWIREELEAEYWAYGTSYPRRSEKIRGLETLALEVGITKREFEGLKKEAKKRVEWKRRS